MSTLLLIILIILLLGGGGLYGSRSGNYRGSGIGVGGLLIIILVVWFLMGRG